METPNPLRSAASDRDDVTITRRKLDGTTELTVDFGPEVDATVDVVGDVAIVVADDEQYEFEIPDGTTDVTTNDGMLIIRQRD